MASKSDVRDRAAENLGILPIGQSLASQDSTRISSAYDEVFADLKHDGLTTWASTGTVPSEIVPYLAVLVAASCIPSYPISPARIQLLVAQSAVAKKNIRRLVTPRYESLDDPLDY